MALRIIRKTGSQSHVEVIRGINPTGEAVLSLLLYIRRDSDREAFRQWLAQANEWLKTSSELIAIKSSQVETPLRGLFTPLPHAIKLLPESEDGGAARRLKSLLQEASCEICVYLSVAPLPGADGWIRQIYEKLRAERNTGAAGPVLVHENRVVCAGLARSETMPDHTLQGPDCSVSYQAAPVTLALAGWPQDIFADQQDPLLVSALPLCGQGLRRPLLQDFDWNEALVTEEELGLAIGTYLHQRQYWVSLLPVPAALDYPPEQQDTWQLPPAWQVNQGPLSSDLASLYHQMGFQPEPGQPATFLQGGGRTPAAAFQGRAGNRRADTP